MVSTTELQQEALYKRRKSASDNETQPLASCSPVHATIAASRESPHGTTKDDWASQHKSQSVLEQHCLYFDRDRDGIIWPLDTYYVCRDWAWSFPVAFFFAGAIHFVQSYGTVPGILPDPCFRIWISNLYKNKHGSCSMSFDNKGRFNALQFDDFFDTHDEDGKGGLDKWDVWRGLKRQALPLDLYGQVSAFFEWFFTYMLLWPQDGVLRKDDVPRVNDGSMFFDKAAEHRKAHMAHRKSAFSSRPEDRNWSRPATAIISFLLVTVIIGPAIAAGACYFVLRFVDDVCTVSGFAGSQTIATSEKGKAQGPAKINDRMSTDGPNASLLPSSSEQPTQPAGPSAGGLVGLAILSGVAYAVSRECAWWQN